MNKQFSFESQMKAFDISPLHSYFLVLNLILAIKGISFHLKCSSYFFKQNKCHFIPKQKENLKYNHTPLILTRKIN